ncbi:hypothetical protein [Cellulomonas sp. Y8]|uniref:hypothetical protein n=1 Tax=Cellulomonas sp. Y8 TaxID=2591145 RepID=UPI003D71ACDE
MPTTLRFPVPVELTVTVASEPGEAAYDRDVEQAYATVRHVLATLDSDDPEVTLDATTGDLPDPSEQVQGQDEVFPGLSVADAVAGYDQAQQNYRQALAGWAEADQRAADATRALEVALGEVEAAITAGHLDGGLDAARDALRAALEAATRAAAPPVVQDGQLQHVYEGRCPEPDAPGQRDPHCPACQALARASAQA